MSATTRSITVEELERDGAPEERWELIDGELVEMSPSGGIASNLAAWLIYLVTGRVAPQRLGKVYGADGGFVLFAGQQTVRVPNVSFVRADRLPPMEDQVGFLRVAPDLAVEVLSPTDRAQEVGAKAQMYLPAGVKLVCVVDPTLRTVTVYAPDQAVRRLGEEDQLDGGAVLPGFDTPVAALFA